MCLHVRLLVVSQADGAFPRAIWQCLERFLLVTCLGCGALASRGMDAAKILQCMMKVFKTRNYPVNMPVVQRLRNPDMESEA